jgi:hypothetical protein
MAKKKVYQVKQHFNETNDNQCKLISFTDIKLIFHTLIRKMQNKENNNPPKKQSAFYSLSIGKNNGAYLSKDVTHENKQSIKLLSKD